MLNLNILCPFCSNYLSINYIDNLCSLHCIGGNHSYFIPHHWKNGFILKISISQICHTKYLLPNHPAPGIKSSPLMDTSSYLMILLIQFLIVLIN